jgi:type I restriction enzyme, S subunit
VKERNIKKHKILQEVRPKEVPYELPHGWKWVRLDDFVYLEMGQSPKSTYYNQDGKGLPFFQGKADFGGLHPTPRYWCTKPNKYAFPNDILLSVRAPVGPTNISNIDCCIGRGLAALRPLAGVPARFVNYLMVNFRNTLQSFATGTTFAAVSKNDIENLLISVPPLPEQHRIVAKIDQLMTLCDTLEQQIKAATGKQTELLNAVMALV